VTVALEREIQSEAARIFLNWLYISSRFLWMIRRNWVTLLKN